MNKEENNLIGSIRTPKAVIFDTDNTLYSYLPAHKKATRAVEEKVVKILGISEETFRSTFEDARQEIKDALGATASSHSRLLYFQRTIEKLGLGTQILMALDLEQTYWRTFLSNCKLFPGVLDFIQLLKSKGVITVNITDLTAQIQFRKLVYFGLDNFFDYVVTSEEAGIDKPDRKPFEVAFAKIKVSPEDIWMIGDSPSNDMAGAHNFGLVKVQKVHMGSAIGSSKEMQPDIVFTEYSKLFKYF
jgi:HAD superfamily hydrolase (TIGR01549 family)